MESNRQKKIAALLQRDLVDVLQGAARDGGLQGVLISVTKVSVTVDLSLARVFLSIFPTEKASELIEGIQSNAPLIKHNLAMKVKDQLRRMPDLEFRLDDSLDYIEKIDQSLGGDEDPITNPELLQKRKKI